MSAIYSILRPNPKKVNSLGTGLHCICHMTQYFTLPVMSFPEVNDVNLLYLMTKLLKCIWLIFNILCVRNLANVNLNPKSQLLLGVSNWQSIDKIRKPINKPQWQHFFFYVQESRNIVPWMEGGIWVVPTDPVSHTLLLCAGGEPVSHFHKLGLGVGSQACSHRRKVKWHAEPLLPALEQLHRPSLNTITERAGC